MGFLARFVSRVTFLIVWIWSARVPNAFGDSWIVPLLGVLFLPCTALAYVLVYASGSGVTGWRWGLVVVAFLLDLSWHNAHFRQASNRRGQEAIISA